MSQKLHLYFTTAFISTVEYLDATRLFLNKLRPSKTYVLEIHIEQLVDTVWATYDRPRNPGRNYGITINKINAFFNVRLHVIIRYKVSLKAAGLKECERLK